MKTHVECLPCFLRQTIQVARLSNCSKEQQLHVVQAVSMIIAEMDVRKSPPVNAAPIYRKIAEITGCEDPYYEQKRVSNQQALQVVSNLRQEIKGTDNELASATRFAIAGNIIDYGALETFDIDAALGQSRSAPLAVDHLPQFTEAILRLKQGSKVLYLTDNCGEIVYDSLLLEYLQGRGVELTIAVKDGPIINDALEDDALEAGLDAYGRIITSSGRVPGTDLAACTAQFRAIFNSAELVIAKGQGNFESLSEVGRDMFFLLTIKCPVAARHMAALSGVEAGSLQGKGEMAIYYSGKKKGIGG